MSLRSLLHRTPTLWAAVVLGACLRGGVARAGDAPAVPPIAGPAENASYVPSDDEGVRRAFAAADAAARAGQWASAVRALQQAAEGPAGAVTAVGEPGVFEGVRVVAHHAVARHGAPALEAYQREFGGVAQTLLSSAVDRLDEAGLAETADRYLPAAEGRAAAFVLADLANERGDADAALEWLARVEDFEASAGPGLDAERARWRLAVAGREAVARARDAEAAARLRASLLGESRVPPAREDLRVEREGPDWPTSGGAASRARTPPPLASPLSVAWYEPLGTEISSGTEPDARAAGRPSPWLPPRAVVAGGRAYVFDGSALQVRELAGGRLVRSVEIRPEPMLRPGEVDEGEDARRRWSWIEGHALTVEGRRAWCAVAPAARRLFESEPEGNREAHVVAVDVENGGVLWTAGGLGGEDDPLRSVRLHGAPCLYRGTLFVAGVRPTNTQDQWEALLVALDPETGALRWTNTVGAGGPVRRRRADEILPGSCAAARGRVLVSTALGVASAVDARTGRTLWTYRYDRGSPDGEVPVRRLEEPFDSSPRRSSFAPEPPIVRDGMCFLAPTDSRTLFATFDRPRGARRLLTAWKRSRTEGFQNLALEHVAGVTDGRGGVPPTLVGVGQGYRVEPTELHACVVALDPATGDLRWARALPDGGPPEPYGRAAVTADAVFVPTRGGIAAFRLADGADLPFTGADARPEEAGDVPLSGNLVVVPGRGLLAVNSRFAALWRGR